MKLSSEYQGSGSCYSGPGFVRKHGTVEKSVSVGRKRTSKIFRANARQDKVQVLQEAREHLEVVRLYVRIMRDLHQIGNKKFVNINQRIENVSKQLTGWQKKSMSL